MTLSAGQFPAFFEAVHGHAPFQWQHDLAAQVAQDSWPSALDVPTGMGKTAALDIAVFNLALQAHLPAHERTAPTRTFLVVDRRIVVDQAHTRACTIADAFQNSPQQVVQEVADALRSIAGRDRPALEAVRMRGGTTWAGRWLSSTRQPAIVTGTVDQLGSRMLFRGYGVGDRMKPIDAALCGNDSLILLDEAHLSGAFLQTVDAVRAYEDLAPRGVLTQRRPRTVVLSATGPVRTGPAFRCEPDRETSPAAQARLQAQKLTSLVEVTAKGDLALTLEQLARQAVTTAGRIAVVCNTVLLARQVFDRLADLDGTVDRALLIGRCRDVEKDHNARTWVARLQAGSARSDRPIIVVATQTIEVGADLDVDVLLTEACPLDALTQRLGRLNRLGALNSARAVVVYDQARHGLLDRTPVYGAAVAQTWEWLVTQAGRSPVPASPAKVLDAVLSAPQLDLGIGGILALLSPEVRAELSGSEPPAPVVLSPILDLWAQTGPVPEPDQDVAPFLHGVQRPRPEVSVAWRAALAGREQWEQELRLFPVQAHELVNVGLAEVLRFLRAEPPGGQHSDQEGTPDLADDEEDNDPFQERASLQQRGWVLYPDGTGTAIGARPLRPGCVLVLDSDVGGHDQWGWTGIQHDGVVPDVADLSSTGAWRIRLRASVWHGLLPTASAEDLADLLVPEDDAAVVVMLQWLRAAAAGAPDPVRGPLEATLQALATARRRRAVTSGREGEPTLALAAARLGGRNSFGGANFGTGSDDGPDGASSSVAESPIGLEVHLRDVGSVAHDEADGLGLDPALVGAAQLAGLAHDLGKADPRFQRMLHGGDPYRTELATALLAKSPHAQDSRARRRAAQLESGWPAGMRHESISAAMVGRLQQQRPELFEGVDADLVQHLVASHHGHARPLLPPVRDPEPRQVTTDVPGWSTDRLEVSVRSDDAIIDWSHPARFARLTVDYGRWGLALLEALVRLADMQESERYDREAARR